MSNESLPTITADIVAAYVSNNEIASDDVASLIPTVHAAVVSLGAEAAPSEKGPKPAVSVKQSLADPNIIRSMIDGRPYVTLKRHLAKHGYTPESYREAFGLKPDYPMIAPRYSQMRSDVAKRFDFGRKRQLEEPQPVLKRGKLKPAFKA